MSTQAVVLEVLSLVAPLGVRFWDVAMGAPAGGGLLVTAFQSIWPERSFSAVEGPGGVYSFHALPGLQAASNGAGDDAYWAANPGTIPYTVAVNDPQGRYLPFQLAPRLPWRGTYGIVESPPLSELVPDDTWVPLFSAPARQAPGPTGLVRAQLYDDLNQQPAAWALVTVSTGPSTFYTGMADVRGVISLAVPYPEPRNFAFSSPFSGSVKFIDQVWPIEISVRYAPLPLTSMPAPLLESVLRQPDAVAWTDSTHTSSASGFSLAFGSDLILRSLDSLSGRALPVLFVTPV